MPLIRATRVPEGSPRAPGGPPATVRYADGPMWPGITAPFDARCWGCTWAMRHGVYEIKFRHSMCWVHRRASGG